MSIQLQIITIIISLSLLILTFELIRREKLKERYSLLWLATTFFMLILSFRKNIIEVIALSIGIKIPSNALFFIGFFFLMLIVFYLTIIVSGLSKNNEQLAQEVALLQRRVEGLEESRSEKC